MLRKKASRSRPGARAAEPAGRSSGRRGHTPSGPSLRKAGSPQLFVPRQVELWRVLDYRLRELLEGADVVSEGAERNEGAACTYYGVTSILLLSISHGGEIPDESLLRVVELLRGNPHARTRAVRIACREAQVRCRYPLVRVQADLQVRATPRGIQVDVEVEAPIDVGLSQAVG
jgi:hypothetical protein